ncbi:hypothetical protein SAMD00019534_034240 [Acytostelium subglobosum LB1]|uniref:hypothetical protein n=1 Tax=Acytostelium subglobosum LB1 TaxID=1410327 RepID=UPI000644CB85|nr:hypothetical protein SAMD00019534_034240 [Acytostelium subglobosum LB1]GAM20249.1 hypothetical protein SAMD00019534_034240 [Acytostelium subglobosum LB1]|eukprot:XP_012759770.1 hypothetical protein SAMD00019534_034240 [Acytostelium subglobosum LB1]
MAHDELDEHHSANSRAGPAMALQQSIIPPPPMPEPTKKKATTMFAKKLSELARKKSHASKEIVLVSSKNSVQSDISIDDSMRMGESPEEVKRESSSSHTATEEDGFASDLFESSSQMSDAQSQESMSSSYAPTISTTSTADNAIGQSSISSSLLANTFDIGTMNNNNEIVSLDKQPQHFSTRPINNSSSELPFFQPYDPMLEKKSIFNRSVTENFDRVALDDDAQRFARATSTTTTSSSISNPSHHTSLTVASSQAEAQIGEVPMVEVDIIPEVGANGAEEELVEERPPRRVDNFPVFLCLMKLREIISLLSSNPVFLKQQQQQQLQQQQQSTSDTCFKPKNLIAISNQYLEIYYLSPLTRHLYVIRIESDVDKIQTVHVQELSLKIDFDVYQIKLNDNDRYLCLVGNINWMVVDLNPSLRSSFFVTQDESTVRHYPDIKTKEYPPIKCDLLQLQPDVLSVSHLSNFIQQADWHPLSSAHLVILHSTGEIKIYNIQNINSNDESEYEQSLLLTSMTQINSKGETKPIGSCTFRSFCFGPAVNLWTRFSIFVISATGDVYCLCPVIPNGCLIDSSLYSDLQASVVRQREQSIKQKNTSLTNYCDAQLKWLAGSMNVNSLNFDNSTKWMRYKQTNNLAQMQVALQGPLVYERLKDVQSYSIHSNHPRVAHLVSNNCDDQLMITPFTLLILHTNGQVVVTLSCQDTIPLWANNKSRPSKFDQDTCRYMDLITYEILDTSIPQRYQQPPKQTKHYTSFTYPSMINDPLTDSVYLYHNNGVQCVQFPWLTPLFKSINNIKSEQQQQHSSSSIIVNVIETNPVSSTSGSATEPAPVICLGVLSNIRVGSYLIALSNRKQSGPIIFDLDGLSHSPILPNDQDVDSSADANQLLTSPLKEQLRKFPSPIPKLQVPANLSLVDTLAFIAQIKDYQYKYLVALHTLESTVESRLKSLTTITKEQQSTLMELRTNIVDIRSKQNQLREKVTTAWKVQEEYNDRIIDLAMSCNKDMPLSIQEKELRTELQTIANKIHIYKEKLSYFEQHVKGKPQVHYSKEPIPSEDQGKIQILLKEHSKKIEDSRELFDKLSSNVQELKLEW